MLSSKVFWEQLEKTQQEESDVKAKFERLAIQMGWMLSSDYPDHCWRWSKELKYPVYVFKFVNGVRKSTKKQRKQFVVCSTAQQALSLESALHV